MIVATLCTLLLGAPPTAPTTASPQPGPVTPGQTYVGGTATASTTGARTETFEAELDTEAENGFGDGEDFELEFVAENEWMIRFDFTPAGVGLAEDDWVAIGMPGTGIDDPEYYFDGFETLCETTLTQFDSAGVAGTYTCAELPNGDGSKTIDVEGTFSATP